MAEEALSVFLSYSHRDMEMLAELNTHLAGLRRTNKIETWDDRAIGAGNEWEPAIKQKLNTADIIILLISADFIASDYCYCNELQRAIKRHDAEEACVIPVILKPCIWNDADIPFSKLNVLPDRAIAITKWEDTAEAYTNVAQGISSAVTSLRARKLEKFEVVDRAADTLYSQPAVSILSNEVLSEPVGKHYHQTILEWYNWILSSVVRHLRNRIESIRSPARRLSQELVAATDFSSEIVVDDSINFRERRKSFHKIEIFLFWYMVNQGIEHQIKILIEPIQEHCCQKIKNQHSWMQLLSGEEIGVDQLYVDVWLLGKPESNYFNTQESLLRNFDIGQDRLALSKRIERNPGFEIANSNPKLVILGKPGSGKTTFLKHLAVDWCKGKFQPEQIAVLIELRRLREQTQTRTWNLIDAICQELALEEKAILGLLERGTLLVLLDGLDEVPTDELRRKVQSQIEQVSKQYSNKNRFILTCRTQIMGAIPRSFASVEVADFNSGQIKQFVQNWFIANGKSALEATQQWDLMRIAISSQPDLRELTATPVLLSLICVVWQDSGEIPTNRTNLYKRGISWLLRRWNDEKKIEGWEVGTEAYRQLSLEDKEGLLTEIAARKFENPKNFVLFEQDELVKQIYQKLQLANVQEGIAVLKAVEAQHGLLIERADELWSFSHLTFQEFFTVQWLIQLPPQQLAEKIANQKWQKSVVQLVKSQQPADRLLRLIKQAIDQIIAQKNVVQDFFGWLLQKADSLQTNYKPAAIRAFYYSLTLDLVRDRDRDLDRDLDLVIDLDSAFASDLASTLASDLASDLDLDLVIDLDRFLDRSSDYDSDSDSASDLASDLNLVIARDRFPDLTSDRALASDLDLVLSLAIARALDRVSDLAGALDLDLARVRILVQDRVFTLNRALDRVIELNLSPSFISDLRQLKKELPTSTRSNEIQRWWPLPGVKWSEKLRQVMIDHRNIGHDWQFTPEQNQQLQRYYEANKFLVSLIKIRGAVSEECRTEIEDGLLLPWAELQRRQPRLYGDLKE